MSVRPPGPGAPAPLAGPALSRRRFLVLGGLATAAGAGLAGPLGSRLRAVAATAPTGKALGTSTPSGPPDVHLVGTDGWAYLPPANTVYHPDKMAPAGRNTYVFGFRDVTGLADAAVLAQRGQAQVSAPMLGFDEGREYKVRLTNLGLAIRPDLTDGHTIHFHGFRNAIPLFDGVPEMSVATPIGRAFDFFYRFPAPQLTPGRTSAGTYMYHCHFEDVEHVQMGMTGICYVRPYQNRDGRTYAYNDGDGSTRYDREFGFMLTEMYLQSHWEDAHIQQPDWSQFKGDAWLMNGRSWPDTVAGNGTTAADGTQTGPADTIADGRNLGAQPISSLVTCNSGDRVLLRMANLGYQEHAMTAPGLTLTVVGQDATHLRSAGGRNQYYDTHTLDIGPGESRDAIFVAPAVTAETTFLLYDRNYAQARSASSAGVVGGQMTKVVVRPAGAPNAFAAQTGINR